MKFLRLLPKSVRGVLIGAGVLLIAAMAFAWSIGVRWWWRLPTAQVMIGDRLDIHAAVYQGANGNRLIYIPSSDPRIAGSGICYLAPRTASGGGRGRPARRHT
ncbi:MAG: hypothetical protein JWQ02_3427 [Capsulimonas sp.]|nr:hypothetical protein [Capsulimonas sp.]